MNSELNYQLEPRHLNLALFIQPFDISQKDAKSDKKGKKFEIIDTNTKSKYSSIRVIKEDVFASTLKWNDEFKITRKDVAKFLSDALRRSLKMSSINDIVKEASLQSIDVLDKRKTDKLTPEQSYKLGQDKATDIEVWLQKQKLYDNIESVKHF